MKVTVILCTYNRSQSLARALESVAQSVVPATVDWEVLVVDNNSKDQTRETVTQFCQTHVRRFRYLFEPKAGKSNALNAALENTDADVLAFMDDDVIVEKSWLENLVAPLAGEYYMGSGGRILPQWTSVPPAWLPRQERYGLAPLAMFDLGDKEGELYEAPFGTNMAFRKAAFEKYGGFRADLGPRPGSEIRNEDTEFGQRVLRGGEKLGYVPSAVVYHEVAERRLRKEYFLAWWFDKARADVRQNGVPRRAQLLGVPLYLARRLMVWSVRWMAALTPSSRFACKLKVWGLVGEIRECYRLSRSRELPANSSARPA